METNNPETCQHCFYWKQWHAQPTVGITIGDCRKCAPSNSTKPDGKCQTRWPSTKTDDFCGKFKPRTPDQNNRVTP